MNALLETTRSALAGERAWLVGGAVRDRLLGGEDAEIDLVVDGDVADAARRVARAARAPCFELSEQFGAWRVGRGDPAFQVDLAPLRGGSLRADLALRDFTINAMAEPLAGGELIDPFGGRADLRQRLLRIVGPRSLADDPLRVVRLVRIACELDLSVEQGTAAAARRAGGELDAVAAERVFAELKRIIAAPRAVAGLRLMDELDVLRHVLPEVAALREVDQSHYHHSDVYDHTLEVLEHAVVLTSDPGALIGAEHAGEVAALLAEPLADGMSRGQALRLGALLHDIAKPPTRDTLANGRVVFPGHDRLGAQIVRELLGRLRASVRLREHVAALTLHHLRLGFLVHERPLSRTAIYRYLRACAPVEVDVTLLSVADRLATRGANAREAIDSHLEVVAVLLPEALRWRAEGPPRPLLTGRQLAGAADLTPGPRLGELLEELAEAQFTGEVGSFEEAVAFARRRAATGVGRA